MRIPKLLEILQILKVLKICGNLEGACRHPRSSRFGFLKPEDHDHPVKIRLKKNIPRLPDRRAPLPPLGGAGERSRPQRHTSKSVPKGVGVGLPIHPRCWTFGLHPGKCCWHQFRGGWPGVSYGQVSTCAGNVVPTILLESRQAISSRLPATAHPDAGVSERIEKDYSKSRARAVGTFRHQAHPSLFRRLPNNTTLSIHAAAEAEYPRLRELNPGPVCSGETLQR